MSRRLEAVIDQVRKLPETEQDQLAEVIEQRLQTLERSLQSSDADDSPLEGMARDAIREHRAGRTEPFPGDGGSGLRTTETQRHRDGGGAREKTIKQ